MDSSGDEGEEAVEGTAPTLDALPTSELVMPSIRMPQRRPFTERGRDVGRLKIMVAGPSGEYIPSLPGLSL